jgi:hypothetical protein
MATYVILTRFSPETFRDPKEFKKIAEAVSAKIKSERVLRSPLEGQLGDARAFRCGRHCGGLMTRNRSRRRP